MVLGVDLLLTDGGCAPPLFLASPPTDPRIFLLPEERNESRVRREIGLSMCTRD